MGLMPRLKRNWLEAKAGRKNSLSGDSARPCVGFQSWGKTGWVSGPLMSPVPVPELGGDGDRTKGGQAASRSQTWQVLAQLLVEGPPEVGAHGSRTRAPRSVGAWRRDPSGSGKGLGWNEVRTRRVDLSTCRFAGGWRECRGGGNANHVAPSGGFGPTELPARMPEATGTEASPQKVVHRAAYLLPRGPQGAGVAIRPSTTLRAFGAIFSSGTRRADLPLHVRRTQ